MFQEESKRTYNSHSAVLRKHVFVFIAVKQRKTSTACGLHKDSEKEKKCVLYFSREGFLGVLFCTQSSSGKDIICSTSRKCSQERLKKKKNTILERPHTCDRWQSQPTP